MNTDSTLPLCECCGERPASEEALAHGFELCEVCSQDDGCSKCDEPNACSDKVHPVWEFTLCAECERVKELYEWLTETERTVIVVAEQSGFRVERTSSGVSEAIYLYLSREDGEEEVNLKIRIADHEGGLSHSNHDQADYSIEREASETAYSLETALAAIRKRAGRNQ